MTTAHRSTRAATQGAFGILRARVGLAPVNAPQSRIEARAAKDLGRLIEFAAARSPFYRRMYAGLGDSRELALEQLPIVTKAMMMEDLDGFLTDPTLSHARLARHIDADEDGRTGPDLHGYRTIVTSGSTGLRGLFAFNRREWNIIMASFWRWTDMTGLSPRPWRRRIAVVGAPSPLHFSNNVAASIAPYRLLYLKSGTPVGEMCTRLNAFQPDIVLSYPSVCGQLAHEQMEGVLRISPRHVVTSGELRSTRMSDDIRTAWDTPARDLYAMTEVGVVAGECREAGGLHHFNDLSIIEIVDDRGRPVPTGEQGARILVTNLFMRTQPLIRYEVSDMLTMDGNNCSCGRAWPLIRSISGRLDDLLWFRERDGREIQVHPLQLQSLILGQSWVRGYQICQEPERLLIRIVANSGRNLETRLESLREQVQRKLQELRVLPPPVEVMSVSAIPPENGPGGKVKLVKSYRCP